MESFTDRLLKESSILIKQVDGELHKYYNEGVIDLKRFKNYKYHMNIFWILYGKLKAESEIVQSIFFTSKMKKKYEDNSKDLFKNISRFYMNLRDEKFKSMDIMCEEIDSMLNDQLVVKCTNCNKEEKYSGQGIVIDYKYIETDLPKFLIGKWTCGNECLQNIT